MGNTGTPSVISAASSAPSSFGSVKSNSGNLVLTIAEVAMGSASTDYATGGQPVTLPTGMPGALVAVVPLEAHDGTRMWFWNGSRSAPKLVAYDAFATEEGNATTVNSVTLTVLFISAV